MDMPNDMIMLASVMVDVHRWFSWVVITANGSAGLWALIAHRRHGWRSRALWIFTAVAQVSMFVQAVIGSWLMAGEGREAPELHAVYGFSALVAVGIVHSYRQQLPARHIHLLYGGAGLFLMGLGIRAMILD